MPNENLLVFRDEILTVYSSKKMIYITANSSCSVLYREWTTCLLYGGSRLGLWFTWQLVCKIGIVKKQIFADFFLRLITFNYTYIHYMRFQIIFLSNK